MVIALTYVSIELPDEAREVAVLEVVRKKVPCELRRPPHDEGGLVVAPRHYVIG